MKAIPGFDGYFADEDGNIWSHKQRFKRKRVKKLTPCFDRNGYKFVRLCLLGKASTKRVHNLVALAYYGAMSDGLQVCHNNGNKLDNRPENLRYDTNSSNKIDTVLHGNHPSQKLSFEDYKDIRWLLSMGWLQREVADVYNISKTRVSNIKRKIKCKAEEANEIRNL